MADALVAGTAIALACGVVGTFLVLRAQVFAGDALSHVAFTGGLAAAAGGVDVRFGVFAASVVVAVGMGALGTRRADDAAIGTMFAWMLGLGALFLALFTTHHSSGNGAAAVRVLFGSLFGLTRSDVWLALAVSAAAVAAVLALARPLLLTSLDPQLARALGVPVRALEIAFLAVVGAVAAEATQAVGALLLLGLVAAPAAAALRIARSPYAALAWSAALAAGAVWVGLALAAAVPQLPASTAIVSVAATAFAATRVSFAR
ncbi:MAG TPA: iron chelate uptake ABC transporter family permease subunit [Solirubrobacteraceae bacterium]|nr:iron chelate uptake ABC transporter family permease subunit [Solirubrobacteraceae bacterium]